MKWGWHQFRKCEDLAMMRETAFSVSFSVLLNSITLFYNPVKEPKACISTIKAVTMQSDSKFESKSSILPQNHFL